MENIHKSTYYQLAKVRKDDKKITLLPIAFDNEANAVKCATYLEMSLTYSYNNIMVIEYQKDLSEDVQ